jgi:hypothetical protein
MTIRRAPTRTARNSNLLPISGFRDPLSVPDIVAWYDTSDTSLMATSNAGTGAVTSGSTVGYLADKSGNGWNLTQGTANNRPTWNGSLNGMTVLSFDGSNDVLSSSTSWPLTGDPAWSLFVVHTRTVTTSGYPLSWGLRASGNVSVNDENVGRWLYGTSGAYFQTVTNSATNTAQVISGVKPQGRGQYLTTYRSGSHSVFGYQGLTTTAVSVASAAFNLGLAVSGPSYHNGLIAEVLIYSRALTDTEHRNVCLWLGARWGVTIP